MASSVHTQQEARSRSADTHQQIIGKWNVGGRSVCLFRDNDRFAFSTEGQPKSTFKSTLYDVHYASNLIEKFRHVIGINLEREEPHASCFLPKFCMSAQNAPGVEVALFGRLDTRTSAAGELTWVRWGSYDTATKDNQTFEGNTKDPVTEAFMKHAPNTNSAYREPVVNDKGEPVVDKEGRPVLQEGSGSYAMAAYTKKFCVSVTQDQQGRVQRVALHHLSVIDGKTHLDTTNWAVTLLSTQLCSGNLIGKALKGKIGHAMLACEGVQDGKQFLKYVHLTQNPRGKNPQLKSDEAQVEIFDKQTPLNGTVNGPTWTRSNALVQNIFKFAEALRGKPLKFAFSGDLFFGPSQWVETFRLEVLEDHDGFRKRMRVFDDRALVPSTCLDWAREMAGTCGIILGRNDCAKRTPMDEIQRINSCRITVIPNGFDNACLGEPFSGDNIPIREQFLFSGVVLSPSHCPPEDCEKWRYQWELEGLMAIETTIKIMKKARSYGLRAVMNCFPTTFLDRKTGIWKQDPYTHPYLSDH